VEPDGAPTLVCELWRVNDKRHRVDGPAVEPSGFFWHDAAVGQEDLPRLRGGVGLGGGAGLLVPLLGQGQ